MALAGAIAFFAGCASEPESHLVSAPPPGAPVTVASPVAMTTVNGTTVVTAPAAPSQGMVIVTQAPPAMQTETVPPRPSSDYVWVAGYWAWNDSRYEWIAGHWTIPPRAGATWIPPRWDPEGSQYRFYEGYWD